MESTTKERIITAAALIELIAVIVLMVLGVMKNILTGRQSDYLVAAGLFVFWILTDILAPVVGKRFDGITLTMREAYVKFILLDLAGYAGIIVFLMGVGGGSGSTTGIIGAVIYAACMKPKRENHRIFLCGEEPEEEESEEEEPEEEKSVEKE